MIADELEIARRLGEVDPLSDDRLRHAEAPLMAAIATAAKPESAARLKRKYRRSPRRRGGRIAVLAAGSAAVLAAIAGVVLAVGGPGRPGGQPTRAPRFSAPAGAGHTMRLASYRFRLPASYRAAGHYCAPLPAGITAAIPVSGSGSFAAADSANGGCIEGVLAAGSISIPARAQADHVGPYQGFLSTRASTRVDLYVEIPTLYGHHYLVLIARGMTSEQLVTVAKNALPSSTGPARPVPCNGGCG